MFFLVDSKQTTWSFRVYSNVLCLGTLRKEAYIQFMPQ